MRQKLGGVEILVTNTGGPPREDSLELTTEQWQQSFQNLWLSAVDSITSVLPEMRSAKWANCRSTPVAAKEIMTGLTISNSLRAGLSHLVKSVSQEVAADGVTVNAVLPGYHATERLKELGIPEDNITAQIPARRLGKPEELAALVAFLSSQHAGYITGQSLVIYGGLDEGKLTVHQNQVMRVQAASLNKAFEAIEGYVKRLGGADNWYTPTMWFDAKS